MTSRWLAAGRGAALAALAMAGWLVLRDAMGRQFAEDRPDLAVRAWPASGNALVMQGVQRITASGGVVDADGRALIARAMARLPAAGAPLALAGLDASAAGELDRATALMEAARHRSPRLVLVRTWLLNEYARTGRYADALAEAGPVMRLAVDSREQVYGLIRAIALRPDGAAAVQAALAADPDWRAPYQAWLAASAQAAAPQ